MTNSWRRVNLAQAYLRLGKEWASADELIAAGADCNPTLIYRAARRMLQHGAIEIADASRGRNHTRYRFTPRGLRLLNFIPAKMEKTDDQGDTHQAAP